MYQPDGEYSVRPGIKYMYITKTQSAKRKTRKEKEKSNNNGCRTIKKGEESRFDRGI